MSMSRLWGRTQTRWNNLRYLVRVAQLFRESGMFLWNEAFRRRVAVRIYTLHDGAHRISLRHRTPDLGSVNEVFLQGNYDPPEVIARILRSLPANLLAVDLGANIGLFGIRLLQLRPDSRLIAFEPDPGNADLLRRTIAANGMSKRWDVIEACAAASDGVVPFRSGQYTSSCIDDAGDPVRALDAFPVLATADVLKIDIEGAEEALLEDPRFLRLKAALIVMEYHPPITGSRVTAILAAAGYRVVPFSERLPGIAELWAYKVTSDL